MYIIESIIIIILWNALLFSLPAVVHPPPLSSPLYLQALMPAPEDSQDSITTDEEQKTSDGEVPLIESRQVDVQVGESPAESMDTGGDSGSQTETYENPFLKLPKRIKLKLFSHQ